MSVALTIIRVVGLVVVEVGHDEREYGENASEDPDAGYNSSGRIVVPHISCSARCLLTWRRTTPHQHVAGSKCVARSATGTLQLVGDLRQSCSMLE